jgi:hypothetical protein
MYGDDLLLTTTLCTCAEFPGEKMEGKDLFMYVFICTLCMYGEDRLLSTTLCTEFPGICMHICTLYMYSNYIYPYMYMYVYMYLLFIYMKTTRIH